MLVVAAAERAVEKSHLLLNRRLPYSFEGEPAPDLLTKPIAPAEAKLLPSGYLRPDPEGGSFGEFAVVDEAERD